MRVLDLVSPVWIVISPEASLEEARKWLILSDAEALVVGEDKEFFGIIERRVIENAIRYRLEGPVIDFTDPDAPVIDAEESLSDRVLTDALFTPSSFALVVKGGVVLGTLSLRDVLAYGCLPRPVSLNIRDMIDVEMLNAVREVADGSDVRVFLVGGGVRDIILGEPLFDIDLVVSKGAAEFTNSLSNRLCGRLKARSQFETYKIELQDGRIIDIAQSRWEYYASPAALPKVGPGPLWGDLFRRDFTINAMALGLNGPFSGRVFDFFGGIRDLRLKRLRIHHILSFVEDPTRIFRAARYITRFNLECSKAFYVSLALVRNYNILKRLSPARIRGELKRILEEPFPENVLAYLFNLGVFDDLFHTPTKHLLHNVLELFAIAKGLSISKDELLEAIGLFFSRISRDWAQNIGISERRAVDIKRGLDELESYKDLLLSGAKPSKKVALLDRLPTSVLLVFAVLFPLAKGLIREYLVKFKNFSPRLSGRDLIRAGVKSGPEVGIMLKRLREAWLDGEISSPEQEWDWLRKEFPDVFP